MGTGRTTRCCSAIALGIALAQNARPADTTPLLLFPVQTVWTLRLNNRLTVPPVYSGGHAFFAIEGDRLVAYELEHGRQAWMASALPMMEPAAGDGLLFVVESMSLRAIRTKDGSTAWQLPSVGELAVPPVWDNGWLVLATRAGEVLAFRAIDGHLIWRRDLGSRAHAPPSLAADRVYVPVEDGRIVALRVDMGEPLWERRLGGSPTGLLALEDRLFAGSNDNFFYALDTTNGRIAWRWRTGADVVGVPVVDERNVYFVSLDNVLRALSRRSGVQQWARLLPLRPTRGPLKVDRSLIVSGVAPTVRAYNIKDGTPAGDLPAEGELAGAPHAVPNPPGAAPRLLVVTRDIATGATARLFTRRLEPPASNFLPPTSGLTVITTMPDVREE